jgi:hypothetical protein
MIQIHTDRTNFAYHQRCAALTTSHYPSATTRLIRTSGFCVSSRWPVLFELGGVRSSKYAQTHQNGHMRAVVSDLKASRQCKSFVLMAHVSGTGRGPMRREMVEKLGVRDEGWRGAKHDRI